ncbi:MAG: metallophosphoesterase [Hyphomonadaceae bacterium]|nr:metallophosphoesterase [Hyphomonadaceae bacterium]
MRRIVQVSDTHLGAHLGANNADALATLKAASAVAADLVVNTGDITANGAADDRDLHFAREAHGIFSAPLRCVPGNHDVGEEPGAPVMDQPIDARRIARYRSVFGADRWVHDLGLWRLIGFNSLLVGTGLEEEDAQYFWLANELNDARDRPIGVFLHKPLWLEHPDDEPAPLWTIDPEKRARYRNALSAARFIASGHLHQYRARESDGALHIWAPSAAFPMRDHDFGGERKIGFLTLDLADDGAVSVEFIRT